MRVRSTFVCPSCDEETTHELHYAGDTLHEIRCTNCGAEFYAHHHPVEGFASELRLRVVSKPARLIGEMRASPGKLVRIPARIISKPVRMARELIEVLR
jgi:uncharacterized Zn finger protein